MREIMYEITHQYTCVCVCVCVFVCARAYAQTPVHTATQHDLQLENTHDVFLIRCQRGHPGVVLLLVISNSVNN